MLKKKFTKRQKITTAIVSTVISVTFYVIYLILSNLGIPFPFTQDQAFAFMILVAIIPAGLMDLADTRWKSEADENIPKLVVDVNGYVRSGQNVITALELAADRDYGVLTPELKRFKSQLSWGIPVEKALDRLSERIGTLLSRRTISLLVHIAMTGGKVQDVLESLVKHVSELRMIERERKSSLRPYIFTTYIAFLVFLTTVVLLFNSFFIDLARTQATIGAEGPFKITLDVGLMRSIFYQISIIEAAVGGLVAGKLGEGSMGSGIKHVIVLIFITMMVFASLVKI
jgi:flagellar protein FlaJ